ncbi:uncharacterized protein FOMMEDRAFT_76403 [Fomitiporia mediterranea MF3/22]|uniref:uncharacterized protein n=1 Tax=Fomitiporia mediterranea (strain MF3/22) TaxID=694068 RepID=UPI0004409C41|nr:uncharacterized protein FOMMEDRAFT_76403 [Fomitiporia mediterranea MF3/22]EJD06596.1 hypothetical protein FOMMEDRAFT_76403 [Fomitiporia mediterranea MF3/22]
MSTDQSEHRRVLLHTSSLVCQTLFYGISVYAALMPLSTHFLLKKTTMSRANKFMFAMTIFMFLLSSAFWASSVAHLVATLNVAFAAPDHASVAFILFPLFNAILLINYVLTDTVVVWRAWVLCKGGSRRILWIPFLFLMCTSLSVLVTISIRVAIDAGYTGLNKVIDISQIANLVLSLLTNMSATSIIAFRAWQHRQSIRDVLSRERTTSTKVERILTLLVDSGLIYCISGILVLIASMVHLPVGTLGDIYTPVHVQVAGIYPTVVLILVSQQRSLKEGAFSTAGNATGVVSAQIEAMDFRTNPALTVSMIFHNEFSDLSQDQDEDSDSSETRTEHSTDGPEGPKVKET